ncbi:MAG: alpha/beta fold hydrolase, partial [Burkholderiaceae bacterium]
MTQPSPDFTRPIQTVEDAAALAACAARVETPCGDVQSMVWHIWGQGAPVVLLHGGAGSWNHWVRNIGSLVAAGRRVLVPDLPGFGDSARAPAARDADALPPWVERGLIELIGPADCDVVGFSFGGMVAGLLA